MLSSTGVTDGVAAFAWAQWSALGAGGWSGSENSSTTIDPELLVVLTAWVAADHPRVHAVAQAWLHRYDDLIAQPRLKNLLIGESEELRAAVAVLLSSKSAAPPNVRSKANRAEVELPSLVGRRDLSALRARAAVGVGARAEILRLLAQQPEHHRSTAWLARYSAYSKRNVADAMTMLARAELVTRRRTTNADAWTVADPALMRKLLGPLPRQVPSPPVELSVLRALAASAAVLERHASDAAVTEAIATMATVRSDIEALGIAPLELPGATDHRAAYDVWARAVLRQLAP